MLEPRHLNHPQLCWPNCSLYPWTQRHRTRIQFLPTCLGSCTMLQEAMRLVDTRIILECFKMKSSSHHDELERQNFVSFDLCVYGMHSINRKRHHMGHIVHDMLAAQSVSKQNQLQVARLPLHGLAPNAVQNYLQYTTHAFVCTTTNRAFCACAALSELRALSNQKSKACVKLWKTMRHLANMCHEFYKVLYVLTKQKGSF